MRRVLTSITLCHLGPPKYGALQNADTYLFTYLTRVLVIFLRFHRLQRTLQKWNATKWLEIDKDDLRIEFLALDVHFNSLNLDPLSLKRPPYVGVKLGVFVRAAPRI